MKIEAWIQSSCPSLLGNLELDLFSWASIGILERGRHWRYCYILGDYLGDDVIIDNQKRFSLYFFGTLMVYGLVVLVSIVLKTMLGSWTQPINYKNSTPFCEFFSSIESSNKARWGLVIKNMVLSNKKRLQQHLAFIFH